MKKITRIGKSFFPLLLIVLLLAFLSGCDSLITGDKPVIHSFSTSPPTITEGESSTLSWEVSDADSVTITPGIGAVAVSSGTHAVTPVTTTTYTLTATNDAGSTTATTTVTVNPPAVTSGSIDIKSTPAGAKVYLDGEDTGYVTPAVLPDISAGAHTLLLTKYLYNNWESTIDFAAGQTYIIAVDLEEAAIEEMSIREGIDAGVETINPDNNYSDLEFLAVGDSAIDYNTMRSFIKFDLSSIPAGSIITKTLINLYYFDDWGSGDIDIDLHEVSEDWQENQITWNTMPDYETTKVADFHCNISNLNSFLGDEITTLCRLWVEQSKPNYGLMLKVRDENTIAYAPKFYSLEYPDVTKRPLLRIEYYIP